MMCRGGLLWYRDIVVFPCRVQEKYEEVNRGGKILSEFFSFFFFRFVFTGFIQIWIILNCFIQ